MFHAKFKYGNNNLEFIVNHQNFGSACGQNIYKHFGIYSFHRSLLNLQLMAGVTCGQGMLTLPEHLIPPPGHCPGGPS